MSCNRNNAIRGVTLGALALVLGACAKQAPPVLPPAPVAAPPPPPAASPPRPAATPAPTYRVRTGSADVLRRYPVGTVVTRDSIICLAAGEQITIVGANGQQVSYRGPGCAQRTGSPTGTNPGGFIFGWNRSGGAPAIEVAP